MRTKWDLLPLQVTVSFVLAGFLFVGCSSNTSPDSSLEPVPPPSTFPDHTIPVYYMDADSLVSLAPRLVIFPQGVDEYNRNVMDIELEITITNNGTDAITISGGRATIYSYTSGNRLETVGLDPKGGTSPTHTILGQSQEILNYENDPFDDEIVYSVQETEFFAAFVLELNKNEFIFSSQVTSPGAQ